MSDGAAVRGTVAELRRVVGRPLADALVRPAGPGRVAAWQEVFGPEVVADTLTAHAAASSSPSRLAGTFVASRVVSAFARLQAWSVTVLRRAWDVAPESLLLQVEDGQVLDRLGASGARVVVLPDDPFANAHDARTIAAEEELLAAAAASLDDLVDRCAAELSVSGRVSSRLLACDAAFAWLAGLRAVEGRLSGRLPADVLRAQWQGRQPLDELVRETRVTAPEEGTVPFLVRRICCLEYHAAEQAERTYCHSCPLVPVEAAVARRERVLRGERPPPLGDGDRRAPSQDSSALGGPLRMNRS